MKLKKSYVNISLVILILFFTVVGTMNQIFTPQNTFEIPKTSADEITIVTPENKTYIEPDSGYYPATYGFENDEIGGNPTKWVVSEPSGAAVNIISEMDGHNNIVELNDPVLSGWVEAIHYDSFPRSHGTIELWLRFNRTSDWFGLGSRDTINNQVLLRVSVESGKWRYRNSAGTLLIVPNVADPVADKWTHIRIDFRCHNAPSYLGLTDDRYNVTIDGVSSGEIEHWGDGNLDYKFLVVQSDPATIMKSWVDAVGFSWDPNYNIGDNLNEGLLLSYDNTTNLDWQGYSLDGQANNTILGNKTIPLPSGGTHQIQVFANDSLGTMYESAVRHFSVDTTPPEISITYPSAAQEFSAPPAYILSITEDNIEAMWYTLNGGANNPIASEMGTIDSSAWNSLADGPVTIRFYVRDIADREVFEEVIVVKVAGEVPTPPPGIPGYNLVAFIGVTFIITMILTKRRLKK